MTIRFACSQCGKSLKAPEEYVGKKVRCSGCHAVVEVPNAVGMRDGGMNDGGTKDAAPPEPPRLDEHDEEPSIAFPMHKEEEEMVDMTAMVDIVFFLLIFFLVTSLHSLQASIEMPAPDPDQGAAKGTVTLEALEKDADTIICRIEKDNSVFVNESEAPTRQEIIAKLKEAYDGGKGAGKLVVMPHGDCRHETVVMVLDAGAAAGIESVQLANPTDD